MLPKGAVLKQHPNSNWELLSADCGCVVTFRILQDTSVNAYLFLVTLKISPSTWLPLSCMPSSLVYEPLVMCQGCFDRSKGPLGSLNTVEPLVSVSNYYVPVWVQGEVLV